MELAPKGVRVNAVNPGWIKTPFRLQAGSWTQDFLETEFEEQAALTPSRRIGEAEEVAKLIAFIASDDAAFMTGSSVSIDGGRSIAVV